MSRLAKLHIDAWDPELRRATAADTGTAIEVGPMQILAHCPSIAMAVANLGAALKQSTIISERLKELIRLRIAYHNQCRSCMAIRYDAAIADGVDEALVCSLVNPPRAENLTALEKAAIAYADRFANDHLSIDGLTYDGLREHFSEDQLVALGAWVAFCVGFGRLLATWDIVEELPREFQRRDAGRLTPSSGAPHVLR